MNLKINPKVAVNLILLIGVFLFINGCGDNNKNYTPIGKDAVILAFGDSLTYGTGTSKEFSYPTVLERLTGNKVINEGIPGEITSKGLQRLPALLDKYQPQLLILIHGGNDILRKIPSTTTAENLKSMITMAKQRDVQVVMLGVPSFNILSLQSATYYDAIAKSADVPINLDILPEIIRDNKLKSDRIHPNREGYQIMAEAVYQLLTDSNLVLKP